MTRGKTQQSGGLFVEDGFWKLHWRKDTSDSNGSAPRHWPNPAWIGPATGPQKMTKAVAQSIAQETFLSRFEQHAQEPQSAITVADFVKSSFVPEHVALKRAAGRVHYRAILKYVLPPEEVDLLFQVDEKKPKTRLKAVPDWPYLSKVRLDEVRPEHIERLMAAAVSEGYSTQTVKHIRNAVGSIIAHAIKRRMFTGGNPASQARLPKMVRQEPHALTLSQSKEVLAAMQYPEREIALLAIFTGMNVREICGLQWKHVNLTGDWSSADGEPIPPRTIAVRLQWSLRELESVRSEGRARDLRIPDTLFPVLLELNGRSKFVGPDDFVLVSPAGSPINAHYIAQTQLKRIGQDLHMPWLSWRVLHRTRSTLAYELGLQQISKVSEASERRTATHAHGSNGSQSARARIPQENREWQQA